MPSKGKKDEKEAGSSGSSPIVKGDVITVEYDAWFLNPDGTDEIFDTTNEEHAKAGERFDEKTTYAPITTVAGEGRVLAGLDNSFLEAKVGTKSSVEIPPSEGAGERKPNMVEVHSIREMQKQKIDPEPGMRVQLKNRMGTIITVTSGRVRIDFNDPLAGKTIKYEFKIIKKAETQEEKVIGIIEASYGRSEDFEATVDGDILEVYLPDLCKYDQAWFTLKYKIVSDLRELMNFKTIRFVEEYITKDEEETVEDEQVQEETPEEPAEEESSETESEEIAKTEE
jgi:FKBP-type peptidyl-prolyl cis-trans isomerase 2